MSRVPIDPLTMAQKEELERRIAFQQHPDEGEPWEDVKASLLAERVEEANPRAKARGAT